MKSIKYLYTMRKVMDMDKYPNKLKLSPLTIAEHQWNNAKIATILTYWENKLNDDIEVSIEDVLQKAVLSDTLKIFTGDINYKVKNYTPEMEKEIRDVKELIYNAEYYPLLNDNYKFTFSDFILYNNSNDYNIIIYLLSNEINIMFEAFKEIQLGNKDVFIDILNKSIQNIYMYNKMYGDKVKVINLILKFVLPEITGNDYISYELNDNHIYSKEDEKVFSKTFNNYVKHIQSINHIYRYQNRFRYKKRSVAAHQWSVALISLILYYDYNTGKDISIDLLLNKALSHDDIEFFTGDILSNTKKTTDGIYENLISIEKLFYNNNYSNYIPYELIPEFKKYILYAKDESEEGQILKIADIIDSIFESIEEIELGNNDFKEVLNESIEFLQVEINGLEIYDGLFDLIKSFSNID